MTNKQETVGVIIGRFQIDELSEGHRAMIDYVFSQNHNRVVFLVGIRATPATRTNPLSFVLRSKMIKDAYPTAIVWALEDMRDDKMWSMNVDEVLSELDGMHDANYKYILYCGRDSFKSHYSGIHEVVELDFQKSHINATERRAFHGANPNVSSTEFRQGVIHAIYNLAPRIYLTVDIALLKTHMSDFGTKPVQIIDVLMAKKPTEDKWRLPGGFVEAGESFIDAAKRELKEETGLIIESGAKIIGDFNIKDWRIRDATDVSHKTVLVEGWHSWGTAKAADDISEVKWFPLTELNNNVKLLVMEEHHELIQALHKQHHGAYEQEQLDSPH